MMSKFYPTILIALFIPFLFGLSANISILHSGIFSIDKLIRISILYVCIITLLMELRYSTIPQDFNPYLIASITILVILSVHLLYSSSGDFYSIRAKKEVLRIAALILIFTVCAYGALIHFDYQFLAKGLAVLGLLTGMLAIMHSFTGQVSWSSPYVGSYLRAGTSLVDANILGAFLNITTFSALAVYLIVKKLQYKLILIAAILIMLTGRFFTFSTGSLASLSLSTVAAYLLFYKYNKENFRHYLRILLFILIVFSILITMTDMFDTFFYRLDFSKEQVMKSSITGRINQHKSYFALLRDEPSRILYGYGTAELPIRLGTGDLHNGYLRPLAIGGIPLFVCFAFLLWRCFVDFSSAVRNSTNDMQSISICFFAAFIGWSFQAATLPDDTSLLQWFFFILAYILSKISIQTNIAITNRPAYSNSNLFSQNT